MPLLGSERGVVALGSLVDRSRLGHLLVTIRDDETFSGTRVDQDPVLDRGVRRHDLVPELGFLGGAPVGIVLRFLDGLLDVHDEARFGERASIGLVLEPRSVELLEDLLHRRADVTGRLDEDRARGEDERAVDALVRRLTVPFARISLHRAVQVAQRDLRTSGSGVQPLETVVEARRGSRVLAVARSDDARVRLVHPGEQRHAASPLALRVGLGHEGDVVLDERSESEEQAILLTHVNYPIFSDLLFSTKI